MDDLAPQLSNLESNTAQIQGAGSYDNREVPALILLTKAVLRLDKSSTRLARVNIFLGIVVILIGILQIVVMVKRH